MGSRGYGKGLNTAGLMVVGDAGEHKARPYDSMLLFLGLEDVVGIEQSEEDLVGEVVGLAKHVAPDIGGADGGGFVDFEHGFEQDAAEEEEGLHGFGDGEVVAAAEGGVL